MFNPATLLSVSGKTVGGIAYVDADLKALADKSVEDDKSYEADIATWVKAHPGEDFPYYELGYSIEACALRYAESYTYLYSESSVDDILEINVYLQITDASDHQPQTDKTSLANLFLKRTGNYMWKKVSFHM